MSQFFVFMEHLYGIYRITHSAHVLIKDIFKKYLNEMKKHFQVKLASFCKINAAITHPIDQSRLKLNR